MKKFLMVLCAVVLVFGMFGSASANLISNGDFETGDLTGWTTSGVVDVVNPATPSLPDWLASVQGMDDNFALIGWGTGSGESSLSQSFTVSGTTSINLAFDYAFDFFDINFLKDDTFLAITTYTGDVAGAVTMLDISSSLIGANYGHYEQTFDLDPTWVLDAEMSFTLSEVGGSFWEAGTFSMAGIDNVNVNTAPVPEPSTILLMGAGLFGLVGYNRKRFSKMS